MSSIFSKKVAIHLRPFGRSLLARRRLTMAQYKIQVMVNEHNLPLKDFIEMFPDTNIVWLDNSKFHNSGIYYLKTIKLGHTELANAKVTIWNANRD